ncbi:MAG: PAS domain-containing protein [Leptolyngbya sp. IPPAS B-1204]
MHHIRQALTTGELQVYEQRITIDAQPQDEEVRILVMGDDEVLIMVRDITDRKRAEEALRIAEENYRSIFENALEGIFQSSPGGQFINANSALAKIYGYDSPAEMMASITNIGEQLYVDPEKRAEFRKLLEQQDAVKDFQYRCYCKDGSIIWIQIDARAVKDNDGRVLYYEGIVQDITERKRREDELRRQLEELKIEIDQKKREKEVATLTESSYFQEVQQEMAEVNLDEFWS